jgi:peptidase E
VNLALASDFPNTPNEAVCAALRSGAAQPRIAWIAPATPERAALLARAKREFAGLGFWRLESIAAGTPGGERAVRLDEYDVVYVSGGDPIGLRNDLLRGGLMAALAERVRNGRCLVAASGGAMLLAQNLSLSRVDRVPEERVIADRERFRAIGAAPFELLPHLNRVGTELLDKVARYSALTQCDVLALADGAAWLCDDDGARIVGEALCFFAGELEPSGDPSP